MRGASVFADVLDEKIREDCLAAATAARPYQRPPTLGYFLFSSASVPAGIDGSARARPRIRVEPPRAWSGPALDRDDAPPSRPSRRLSAAQQAALDTFLELGAAIGPHFTQAELRSAFRELARRFHPDRHPDISVDQRVRLTKLFVRARDACRILRDV